MYKKSRKLASVISIFIIMVLSLSEFSCYPGESLTVQQRDLVITNFDSKTDFSNYKTYALSDTVTHFNGNTGEEIPFDSLDGLTREFDQLIIEQIEQNMNSRGYERKPSLNPSEVDLVLMASANTTIRVGYTLVPWWPWGPWGPWWPWYPPGLITVPYTFATGTIFIDMGDAKNRDEADNTFPIRWNAALNGLVEHSASSTADRITDAINQAFAQSEYLQTGK